MKPLFFAFFVGSLVLFSCSKTGHGIDGTYQGFAIRLAPLAPPLDSVGNSLLLMLDKGRFRGSGDTTRSPYSVVVGSGTYSAGSGSITFTQDSLAPGDVQSHQLLIGTYELYKTGDSLVFGIQPPSGIVGGSSTYFRLVYVVPA